MSSQSIEPRLLKGFRDTMPAQMAVRQKLISSMQDTAKTFGFLPLETPALEYADILLGKLGEEGEKLLYQFTDHGDRHVAMRYDFTVPLARVVAQYPDLPKPFKRYQVGPVWRADNTQRGRYREFYQFDLDTVGSDSIIADAEILVAMQALLVGLGVSDFCIRINHRQFLASIISDLNLDRYESLIYAGLDKWDKIGGAEGVIEFWRQQDLDSSKGLQVINQLQSTDGHPALPIIKLAKSMGLSDEHYKLDPTIVRGLDYYTGIVFETSLLKAPEYGSIFSGGRYDGLVGRFAKQPVPAVGTSVGLDRLYAALEQLKLLPQENSASQVLVTVFSDELQVDSLEVVKALRQAGISCEISFNAGDLGKQLKAATAKSIAYAIILGPEEKKIGQVILRNLVDGQEQKLSLDQAVEQLT